MISSSSVQTPEAPATATPLRRDHVLSAGIFLFALTLRVAPLILDRTLTGILENDDGVYYSASAHLARGILPYRDFPFVHPPAIHVVLLPFVELARLAGDTAAMAVARLTFAAVGSLTAVLIFRSLRRFTRAGAVAGALLYAVWRLPATTEHTLMLEPLLSLFLVLGLARLLRDLDAPARRDLFVSGVWLGLALVTKLWAAPEILVIAIYLSIRFGLRRAGVWLAGVAAGALPLALPFLAIAPGAFVREVLVDQLRRAAPDGAREHLRRFADVAGLGGLDHIATALPRGVVAILVIAILSACCLFAWRSAWARLPVLVTAVTCAEMAVAPTYWGHYFAFAAAPICMVVGAALGQAQVLTRSNRRVGAALLPVLVVLGASTVQHASPPQEDLSGVATLARTHRCTWFSSASTAISAGALTRGISRHCPDIVDPYAVLMDAGVPVAYQVELSAKGLPSLQDRYVTELGRSDAIVLQDTLERSEFDSRTAAFVRENFHEVGRSGKITVWERRQG